MGWILSGDGSFQESLPSGMGSVDDADKPNNPHYFQWALQLSRSGTQIIVDNVIRNGEVTDSNSSDPSVLGVQQFYERVAAELRVSATAIQTVGSKGYVAWRLSWLQEGNKV
ncbi:O-methyltransferase [Marininema halotolerans]|uniref:O-methyltransferase n=1 Tax=Marininema halotolerans TaxID=1155944 RepID=A0A1I6QL85_9BACL|nr:O-methyltransferase [Marininema halotolerans]